MEEAIRHLLGLQGYRVRGVTRTEDEDEVAADPPAEGACPRCGAVTARVHQRAAKPSRLLWGFVGQRRLWLVLVRRRLWCAACRRPFTQRVPGLARWQRVGSGARVALVHALKEHSFAALHRSHGVSYGRARRVLERLPVPWCDWEALVGTDGPIRLGIDEHSFRGQDLVITLTCLSTRRVLAILPDDRQATLRACLAGLPAAVRGRVDGVCIDLRRSFKTVVQEVFPRARLVADRFHVIQDANQRLDETRRLEQAETQTRIRRWPLLKAEERLTDRQRAQLAEIQARFPALAEQHRLKEALRALYACADREAAEAHWHRLLINLEASEDAATWQWARTLQRWRKEILGYFTLRLTNAFTEGCHTKVKLQKRLSYGFRNIGVYIRKMLLGFLPTTHATLAPHISS